MRTRWFKIAVLFVILIGGALAWLIWPYDLKSYQGPGKITDTGFWTHPRYHVNLADIPLDTPGVFHCTCRGLPATPMTFVLKLSGDFARDKISQLSTLVEIDIDQGPGSKLCSYHGPLSQWSLSTGGGSSQCWSEACRDLHFENGHMYRIRLAINKVDPKSPKLTALAVLEGGGIEI
jgi:hypothetical protein